MIRSVFLVCTLLGPVIAVIYIERVNIDYDDKVGNASCSYIHDQTGNSLTNVTVHLFVTVTKAMLYLNIKTAVDRNDKEYRVDALKTVIDVRKVLENMQGNPFLRPYFESLKKSMDFKVEFPMVPVNIEATPFQYFCWFFLQIGSIQAGQCELRLHLLASEFEGTH